MSWVKNGYHPWRTKIIEHYGSLTGFSDAPSIRVMLQIARRENSELIAFFDALDGRMQDDPIVREILEDHISTQNAVHELEQWLEQKGLPE